MYQKVILDTKTDANTEEDARLEVVVGAEWEDGPGSNFFHLQPIWWEVNNCHLFGGYLLGQLNNYEAGKEDEDENESG